MKNIRFGEKLKSGIKSWQFFLLMLLLLEFVIFGAKNGRFLNPNIWLSSVNDIISICIIALFETFVMITGGIDIQAGSIVGLSSIIIGVTWQDAKLNIVVACIIAIAVAALCGALSGFFVAYFDVQPMVVTLGGSYLYSGLALLVSRLSATQSYKGISGFPDGFNKIAHDKMFGVIPNQVVVFIVLAVVAYIILHKTKYGRRIFLVGINPHAAEYSGINSKLIMMSTYILSAISASIAGIVLTSYLDTAKSDIGATFTLQIITAAVLGGTLSTGGKGNILGTALAALVIGILRFGLPMCFKINTQYLDIPVGLLLLIVIIGRSIASNEKISFFKFSIPGLSKAKDK